MYNKRIVLDFDDTLSLSMNRDWNNAKPNIKLIEKINKLYFEGWIIDIYTARGSISCSNRKEADFKYRGDIENWLHSHDVKYHSLSFDKPLATYYVDDKGVTPEQFLEIEIKSLEGGLEKSDIFTDGKFAYKTGKNSIEVVEWYKEASKFVNVPSIKCLVGDTITMEYINDDKNFFRENTYLAFGLIQDSLEKLKKNESKKNSFEEYIKRINGHIDLSGVQIFKEVLSELKRMKFKSSFAHGDFGINNMLFKDKTLYLIDPITNTFGCTELDAAKFCASLRINCYDQDICQKSVELMSFYSRVDMNNFRTLVRSELIRIYKYHPVKEFVVSCFKEV